jgi:hypothetical protein
MKVVCDCGNEVEFMPESSETNMENGVHCNFKWDKIQIIAEHDEAWITCHECGKAIHIWAS